MLQTVSSYNICCSRFRWCKLSNTYCLDTLAFRQRLGWRSPGTMFSANKFAKKRQTGQLSNRPIWCDRWSGSSGSEPKFVCRRFLGQLVLWKTLGSRRNHLCVFVPTNLHRNLILCNPFATVSQKKLSICIEGGFDFIGIVHLYTSLSHNKMVKEFYRSELPRRTWHSLDLVGSSRI